MLKRCFDIIIAVMGLLLASPFLAISLFLIWLQDRQSPFFIAPRVGKDGAIFLMVKVRSMIMNANKTGVDSTAADDARITALGRFIRRYKIDEITQLWNVLKGDMSLVGPRPNVERDVNLYTNEERRLLSVRPGITDIASIVFADEGEILRGSNDPDLQYHQIIRPWKSRLGLIYIDHQHFLLDLKLIFLTVMAIFSRRRALIGLQKLLSALQVDKALVKVVARDSTLLPAPPPGATEIVTAR